MEKILILVGMALLLMVSIWLLLSRGKSSSTANLLPSQSGSTPTKGEEANFVLHVLNSSEERNSVDIQVFIDDILFLSDNFSSINEGIISIIPHKTYQFQLEEGRHTIKAVSQTGEATFKATFDMVDKHWAIIGYEYWSGTGRETSTKEFEFVIQDKPIYFQ